LLSEAGIMTPSDECRDGIVALIPDLQRAAMRLVRNRQGAAELVQDSVERALRKSHLYQPGTNLRAWLLTILRNQFANDCRRERSRIRLLSEMQSEMAGHRHRAPDFDLLAEIDDMIRALPPSDRQIIRAYATTGFSNAAVASALGTSSGNVRSRISRARRKLRTLMDTQR